MKTALSPDCSKILLRQAVETQQPVIFLSRRAKRRAFSFFIKTHARFSEIMLRKGEKIQRNKGNFSSIIETLINILQKRRKSILLKCLKTAVSIDN